MVPLFEFSPFADMVEDYVDVTLDDFPYADASAELDLGQGSWSLVLGFRNKPPSPLIMLCSVRPWLERFKIPETFATVPVLQILVSPGHVRTRVLRDG